MGLADDRAGTGPGVAVTAAPRGARVAQGISDALLLGVSSGIAALAAYAIWRSLPEDLDVRTDIVGYPTYANFNFNRYFWLYWLIAGFVPLVSLALFLALRRVVPRQHGERRPRPRMPAADEPLAPLADWRLPAVGTARVLFVGALFGLEAAVATSRGDGWIASIGLPVTLGYAAMLGLVALAGSRIPRVPAGFWERLALANALAIPFLVGGLYAVSRSTEVTVATTGAVHEYSWFPGWLAAGLAAALLGWVLFGAFSERGITPPRKLERRGLLLVAGPVAILLFVASLPGAPGGIDFFHEGEPLAAERLTEAGAFPWRDLIFIHGFFADVAIPGIGTTLFEDSRWAWIAGSLVVVVPLYWISLYYLFAYLFHRNWLFLVGTQLALVLGVVYEGQVRFLFLPFVLLLLAALLARPSPWRAVAFMAALVAETIVTPEAGLAAVAVLVAVVGFDLYYYDRGKPFRENFRRTWLCAAAGTALTAVWLVFLAGFGALDDFVFTSSSFASDHALTGALPVHWISDRYRFAVVVPVLLVVLAFWYFALQMLRRAPLTIADWIMGASALFVALYYQKGLSRADGHVFQAYAVAVPLLYYAVYRVLGLVELGAARLTRRLSVDLPIRPAVAAVAVAVLLVQAPQSLAHVVRDVPGRLEVTVPDDARSPGVGFIESSAVYGDLLHDLDAILDAYAGQNGGVFDFTNSPALFHYLLERPSPTRYYHVSMAIRRKNQDDLVDELEHRRPNLVVFSSPGTGLPVWDGLSNQVRHYRVSEYLLDHYRPLLSWRGYTFLWRAGVPAPQTPGLARRLGGKPVTRGLYFRSQICDWGHVPSFFDERPRTTTGALRLETHDRGQLLSVSGWAVDRKAKTPAVEVLAAVGDRVVAAEAPSIGRPDIAAGDDRYLASGYTVALPVGKGGLRSVRIYGLSRSGRASELAYTAAASWGAGRGPGPKTLRYRGRRVRVVGGAIEGFADASTLSGFLADVDLPPRATGGRYRWLELESSGPLRANDFMLSDNLSDPSRAVFFKTLDSDERKVRVLVGACSQWRGYGAGRLQLRAHVRQPIRAIRLYR